MKCRFASLLLAMPLCALVYGGPGITPGSYDFTTFAVAGTAAPTGSLGVEHINDFGFVVGYQATATATAAGFLRWPTGAITSVVDSAVNTSAYKYTLASDVNDLGTVVGAVFNDGLGEYSGFFYQGGKFTIYNVPGLPAFSNTIILGINDWGVFCGYYQARPALLTVPFVNTFGHIDTNFPIAASTFTEPESCNNVGQVAGTYIDSHSVDHGFFRDRNGKITLIDVPGAAFSGTVVIGLNDFGWISGHFWDATNHEHGFARSPNGKFYQIDVPGADPAGAGRGTAGGGINNEGIVVGHYDPPSGGTELGYIARPKDEIDGGDH